MKITLLSPQGIFAIETFVNEPWLSLLNKIYYNQLQYKHLLQPTES